MLFLIASLAYSPSDGFVISGNKKSRRVRDVSLATRKSRRTDCLPIVAVVNK
jgi:hypothetical protein